MVVELKNAVSVFLSFLLFSYFNYVPFVSGLVALSVWRTLSQAGEVERPSWPFCVLSDHSWLISHWSRAEATRRTWKKLFTCLRRSSTSRACWSLRVRLMRDFNQWHYLLCFWQMRRPIQVILKIKTKTPVNGIILSKLNEPCFCHL